MSTKTTNLGLIKPELTDAADITAMNGNWDKIDEKLKYHIDGVEDISSDFIVETSELSRMSITVKKQGNVISGGINFMIDYPEPGDAEIYMTINSKYKPTHMLYCPVLRNATNISDVYIGINSSGIITLNKGLAQLGNNVTGTGFFSFSYICQ